MAAVYRSPATPTDAALSAIDNMALGGKPAELSASWRTPPD